MNTALTISLIANVLQFIAFILIAILLRISENMRRNGGVYKQSELTLEARETFNKINKSIRR